MNIKNRVVVVTGGANGIGQALCRRFALEGAAGVVVADIDKTGADRIAREIGGLAIATDVRRDADLAQLVNRAIARYGRIDLFCSNAGIVTDDWQRIWEVNVMAHVYAARAVLPAMLARGEGYLLQTASAAGLLTQIGSAPYAVTKHAAVAYAEWLAITHGDSGIKVSCLCPQGVRTRMLTDDNFPMEGSVSPEEVAEAVIEGLSKEQFLILPHPEVAKYFHRKADDYDRWLKGMRRLAGRASRPVLDAGV